MVVGVCIRLAGGVCSSGGSGDCRCLLWFLRNFWRHFRWSLALNMFCLARGGTVVLLIMDSDGGWALVVLISGGGSGVIVVVLISRGGGGGVSVVVVVFSSNGGGGDLVAMLVGSDGETVVVLISGVDGETVVMLVSVVLGVLTWASGGVVVVDVWGRGNWFSNC